MKKPTVRKGNQSIAERTRAFNVVLDFLSRYPNDSFSLSEVARQAGVSKSTASRVLTDMLGQGMIVNDKIADYIWRVRFNPDNLQSIGYKIGANIVRVYQSRIVEFIMQEWGIPKSIVLFGSYRKGEDAKGSDVDIAIEIGQEKELEIKDTASEKFKEFAQLVHAWESLNERKFKLHFFNRNKIDRNLFISIANGILLYGLLEVNP
jgi:predicted nucleotidyltransferase/AraC-like DNA-binding protein